MIRTIRNSRYLAGSFRSSLSVRLATGTPPHSASSGSNVPPPPSEPERTYTSTPAAWSGGGPSSQSKASKQHAHKLSENVSDASFIGSEAAPFAALKHLGYKALHARRMVLPLVGLALWAWTPLFSVATADPMQAITTLTVLVALQRLTVRGATNALRKDLRGKICVVTGGTSGIGSAVVGQLLSMGATVFVVSKPLSSSSCGSSSKQPSEQELIAAWHHQFCFAEPVADIARRVAFVGCDFFDQAEVAAAAAKVKQLIPNASLDVLVNCAGVLTDSPRLSKQGVEEHISVNFLSPFHFTEALLPLVRNAGGGRIVYVTCSAHHGVRRSNVVRERMQLKPGPDESQVTARCYSASKLGNILHARWLAQRRYEDDVGGLSSAPQKTAAKRPFSVCTVDPGTTATDLGGDHQQQGGEPLLGHSVAAKLLRSLWYKDPMEGSQTIINCCVRDDLEAGGHYYECRHMPYGINRIGNSVREMEDVCRWAAQKLDRFLAVSSPR